MSIRHRGTQKEEEGERVKVKAAIQHLFRAIASSKHN
jgi:hypothetical protein